MIIKKIFTGICITVSASLFSMQPEQPAPTANIITLVSAQGDEFQLPLDAAQEAGTISGLLLAGGQEAANKRLEFKSISTPVMAELVQILEKLALNKNANNKRSLLENFKSIPIKNAKEILEEADFLDIPLIKDIIAYRFAQLLTKQKISPETFQQQLEDTELRPDLLQSLLQKVTVFYYVFNPNNPTLQGSAYGLSIQDYLDFNPELIEARRSLGNVLSLSYLHLISLEGLHNIPNIASVTMLYLDHNQLEQIQPYTFDGLQNLNMLMLNYNKLRQIHQQAFAGLMNLQNLYLNNNQLQQIQQNTFAGLHNVYDLHLENNQLQQIQLDSFAGLHNLHSLNLENNQLQQIQPQAFAKLQNLRSLDLRKNKLSDIRPTLFENLPYLHNLYLSRNPITREKKDALRVALPDVNI